MGPPSPVPQGLRALAELWVDLHNLGADGFWVATGQARSWSQIEARLRAPVRAYVAWTDGRGTPFREAARLCLEALERSLIAAARLIPSVTLVCFCRSDARFANVIARPDGRLGLVDWEDSGLRDPAREVADVLMHPNQEDLLEWDAWQAFLSVYASSRRDDPGFESRLQGCLAVFPVFWLGILLEDGMQRIVDGRFDSWLINEMEPNTRLRRYLARAQTWPDPSPAAALAKLRDLTFFSMLTLHIELLAAVRLVEHDHVIQVRRRHALRRKPRQDLRAMLARVRAAARGQPWHGPPMAQADATRSGHARRTERHAQLAARWSSRHRAPGATGTRSVVSEKTCGCTARCSSIEPRT